MFLLELFEILFPKPTLKLYPDEVPTTEHYHEVTERAKPWWDRAGIEDTESLATQYDHCLPAKPGITVDVEDNGPVTLNLHIQRGKKRGKNN